MKNENKENFKFKKKELDKELRKEALEEGWTEEDIERGYGIFEGSYISKVLAIEKIDCINRFEDDWDACRYAEEVDGVQLIKRKDADPFYNL